MGALLRLARVGTGADSLRVVLTVLGSALATIGLLCAATVAAIGPEDGPYTSAMLREPGLHPGVVAAFVGLCVPVFVLLAQCSRIGAPERDRRLAALRMAGADPGDVATIVAAEAALASGLGSVLGAGLYFVLDVVLAQVPTPAGSSEALRLPTDVTPAWWVSVLVALAVPVAVSGGTVLALRWVVFTPFGVVRRARSRAPRLLPVVLLVVGLAGFFLMGAQHLAGFGLPRSAVFAAFLVLMIVLVTGLLAGQAALTSALGTALSTRTSRASLLLAARRMIAEPFAATRATSVLTVAVFVAAGAQQLRSITIVEVGADDRDFYAAGYDLVDLVLIVAGVLAALGLLVAAAEGIVARRRAYAAVVACGTPRGVVARAVLAEVLLPLVPSLLVAAAAGVLAAGGLFGRTVTAGNVLTPTTVGVPWLATGVVLLAAGLAALATTSVGLLFLRRATDIGELRAAA